MSTRVLQAAIMLLITGLRNCQAQVRRHIPCRAGVGSEATDTKGAADAIKEGAKKVADAVNPKK